MPFPDPIIVVLTVFQPLFTVPTWRKLTILLAGTLLTPSSLFSCLRAASSGSTIPCHCKRFCSTSGIVIGLDFFVASLLILRIIEMFTNLLDIGIPFALIFASTFMAGLYITWNLER
jgi:hypothetical protein